MLITWKMARKKLGISQRELATMMDMDLATVRAVDNSELFPWTDMQNCTDLSLKDTLAKLWAAADEICDEQAQQLLA